MVYRSFSVLFVIIIHSSIAYKRCTEYTIILKETPCPRYRQRPTNLTSINWEETVCPRDSTNIVSYDEIYSNKECILEFEYASSTVNCFAKMKPTDTGYKKHTFIPTKDDKNDTSFVKCKAGETKACGTNETKGYLKEEIAESISDINLIYANKNTTVNSSISIDTDLKHFNHRMQCYYSKNICTDTDILKNDTHSKHNVTINSIIAFIVPSNNVKTQLKAIDKTMTDFNCKNPTNNSEIIQDEYVTLTYNIIKTYHCGNSSTEHVNNTRSKRLVNVYVQKDDIYNISKNDYVNCADFQTEDVNSLSINCNVKKFSIIKAKGIDPSDSDVSDMPITDINRWLCDFKKYNFDNIKILSFENCTEDRKFIKSNDREVDNNITTILSKEDPSKVPYRDIEEFGPFIDIKNITLLMKSNNQSICNETIGVNNTNVNMVNLWTDDEEKMIRQIYDPTLVQLNVSNCVIKNSYKSHSDKSETELLELNIILNTEDTTRLNSSILKDLNIPKENTTEKAVLECKYPNISTSVDSTSIDPLTLKCDFKYLEPASYGNSSRIRGGGFFDGDTETYAYPVIGLSALAATIALTLLIAKLLTPKGRSYYPVSPRDFPGRVDTSL